MSEKIYLYLFILCGILCEAINRVSSEDVAESNTLIRRKRVINLVPEEDVPLKNGDAPYVANIRQLPSNINLAVGTILSKHTVITSASSLTHVSEQNIEVLVGSSYSYRGERHRVLYKKLHLGGHQQRYYEGVALLIVQPEIVFNRYTQPISLHEGPLLAGTPATVYGWGFQNKPSRGTEHRLRLRSITVPIMRQRQCANSYQGHFDISDKEICIYDAHKKCGHTDGGAPLVVNHQLAGFYLWTGQYPGQINPDVFADIQNLEYGPWIRSNIIYM